MRFQPLTATSIKMTVFWDVASHSLAEPKVLTASIIRAAAPVKRRSTSTRLQGAILIRLSSLNQNVSMFLKNGSVYKKSNMKYVTSGEKEIKITSSLM
jgi:hypothetical protein